MQAVTIQSFRPSQCRYQEEKKYKKNVGMVLDRVKQKSFCSFHFMYIQLLKFEIKMDFVPTHEKNENSTI